jgi:hypothetical protein
VLFENYERFERMLNGMHMITTDLPKYRVAKASALMILATLGRPDWTNLQYSAGAPVEQLAEHRPLGELAMRVSASVVVLVVPLLIWAWRVRNRFQRLQLERQHEAAIQADTLPAISRRRSGRWTAAWATC